jgi:RNA polymerase sigma factor (sigma-70 family)
VGESSVSEPAKSVTRVSLLLRLQGEGDERAWAEFVSRYGPKVLQWCRRWGLQEADAEDVSQAVLFQVARRMRSFRYDPGRSFRAWLKKVAHDAWVDFLQDQDRPGRRASGDSRDFDALRSAVARDDLVQRLDELYDLELLELAMERVRQRVEPHTWEAFRLTAVERLSGAEVAERLQMKVATVFKAKSKVQKMLREEIARLEGPDREGG